MWNSSSHEKNLADVPPQKSSDTFGDLIDSQTGLYIYLITAFMDILLGVFGTVTNVISMVVFVQQGIDSVTIILLALAFADLITLVIVTFTGILYAMNFLRPSPDIDYISVAAVFGAWPRVLMIRISTWLTVIMCIQRLLCVFIPLKVKLVFTTKRAVAANIFVFVTMTCCYSEIYTSHGVRWTYVPAYNRTRLTMWVTEDRVQREAISGLMNGIVLETIALILICLSPVVMVRSLKTSKMAWRKTTSGSSKRFKKRDTLFEKFNHSTERQNEKSTSHKRIVKLVSALATVLVLCCIPEMLLTYVSRFFVLELNLFKHYHNLYNLIHTIDFQLKNINACVNIFIFYSMSSKFKAIFDRMFQSSGKWRRPKV